MKMVDKEKTITYN